MDKVFRLIIISLFVFSCRGQETSKKKQKPYSIVKTETEWKSSLTGMQFYVLRQAGTERPYTSELNDNHETGTYVCAGCQNPLYKSEHKFNSGTGWPSFDREIKGNVRTDVDYKLGYARRELLCNNCGGHLGHVFNDGPKNTTGKRHCINGVSLQFIPKEK